MIKVLYFVLFEMTEIFYNLQKFTKTTEGHHQRCFATRCRIDDRVFEVCVLGILVPSGWTVMALGNGAWCLLALTLCS